MINKSKVKSPSYLEFLRDETVFTSIIENLNSGIALIDNNGLFMSYNKKFLNLFGFSEGSTIRNVNDHNWAEYQVFDENLNILHVDEHPVRKAAITGKMVRNQLVGVKLPSGGDIIWMLISAEPIFNEKGEIEKTVCTYLDVTSNKLADEALIRSEQRYRQLFNSMNELFHVIELVHDEKGAAIDYIFRDINPAFEKLSGRPKEEMINKKVSEVLGHVNPQWFEIFNDVFRSGNPVRFESWGHIFKRDYELFAWRTAENQVAVVLNDITERKAHEQALKEREKRLQELVATKDKLFSIISHDLKSPFTSIVGFSELLINKLRSGDIHGSEEYARIIYDSSWKSIHLLTNLIEWSRIQTGRMSFHPTNFNLSEVIKEVTGLLHASFLQKLISVQITCNEHLYIFADKSMISTVLRNLVSNAVKFTNTGGLVRISAHKDENFITITVSDNGGGMTSDILANLFEFEKNISTPGTMNEKGTGLGMIICKEFVSMHRGKITAQSEPGKGSKFIIELPVI